MNKLLFLLLILSSFAVKSENIKQLVQRLERGDIQENIFAYDVYEVIVDKVDPNEWPNYSKLSQLEQNILMIVDFEGQINNGGFDQYYFNSYGDNAVATVNALIEIGAKETADILSKSFTVFPNRKPSEIRETRQTQLDALTKAQQDYLDKLDDEFYEYPNDLSVLLTKYANSTRKCNTRPKPQLLIRHRPSAAA
ncbi:hypothetical protein GCM10007876_36580 [Litoribrevibacter albus]|uniref:DNA mimic protein DMP19 C-terminal domain-containing protein n=1 Tax=Litoribrevibacter albus TaxID=1473156 RepID=A0AA37W9C7_9GAMM|nr:hypothetical protein GCM10007876_36580 [Litoribrevibacter albus]